jgi:putative tryptophan/tyrosine transport system substrate-binding protein
VAARGANAAGDAGDRIPQQSIARRVRDRGRRLSPRTAGNGFVEGRNIAIAFRWADGRYDSLPTLAAELVDLPVSLIFAAGGPPTAFAVKAATSTIPIVFSAVRGKTHRADERIDAYGNFDWLFAESGRSDVGLRIEGRTRSGTRSGGRAQGPQRQFRRRARNAFAAMAKLRADVLVVAGEPFFDSKRERIVALSARG